MNPLTLVDLLTWPEFRIGALTGLAGLLVVLALRGRGPWFLVWAAAAAAGLHLMDWPDLPFMESTWALPWSVAVAIGTGLGIGDLVERVSGATVACLFGLTVLGVWGTVPDTEGAAVLMGTTAVMFPAWWLPRRARIGILGPLLAGAILVAVAVTDGIGRPGSIVGALGTCGMLLLSPLVLRLSGSKRRTLSSPLLIAAQVAFVIVSGRLAGRFYDPVPAVLVLSAAVVAFGAGWLMLERWLGPRTAAGTTH